MGDRKVGEVSNGLTVLPVLVSSLDREIMCYFQSNKVMYTGEQGLEPKT